MGHLIILYKDRGELYPLYTTIKLLSMYIHTCSMNNKSSESGIGVQYDNQKSKAAKPLEKSHLYQGWVTAD